MARALYADFATDDTGRILSGASVEVRLPGTGTPISEQLYSQDDTEGSGTLTNPFTSAADGQIIFYLTNPKRVDLYISKPGYTPKTIRADVIFIQPTALAVQDDGVPKTSYSVFNFRNGISVTDGGAIARWDIDVENHATKHNASGSDAMAIDAAAGTGSLRTLGLGVAQAAAGNHGHVGLAPGPHTHNASGAEGDTLDPRLLEVDVDMGLTPTGKTYRSLWIKAVSDEAIAIGDVLKWSSTTEGRVLKTTASTQRVAGVALDVAAGPGVTIRVAVLGVIQVMAASSETFAAGDPVGAGATAGRAFVNPTAITGGGFAKGLLGVAMEASASGSERLIWVQLYLGVIPQISNAGSPVAVAPDVGPSTGSLTSLAKHDHQHGFATYSSPAGAIAIDEGGAVGTSGAAPSRGNHGHQLTTYSSEPPALSGPTGGSAGTIETAPSRGDHNHDANLIDSQELVSDITGVGISATADTQVASATLTLPSGWTSMDVILQGAVNVVELVGSEIRGLVWLESPSANLIGQKMGFSMHSSGSNLQDGVPLIARIAGLTASATVVIRARLSLGSSNDAEARDRYLTVTKIRKS